VRAGPVETRPLSAATAPRAGDTIPLTGTQPGVSERLADARRKFDARLYTQALGDLEAILAGKPSVATASAAQLLLARTYDRLGRPDDAVTTCGALRSAAPAGASTAECTFLMANLILRSKRPDRETSALQLFSEVPTSPKSTWAAEALAAKALIEDRRKLRVVDRQLNTSVPAALVSYRMLVEDYPDSRVSEEALWRLSEMYDDLKRYTLAAESLEMLATRFPDNTRDAWWRAGEMWGKKAKDPARARAAYASVPPGSKRYADAQQRLRP
jgi:outer membrane protein assembly factor BamD (BamD/ComL family)